MSRHLLSPRWIAGHLSVLTLVGAFSVLGMWQLDRLHERREQLSMIESRRRLPPADLSELLPSASVTSGVARQVAHRRVTVKGTFDPEQEVLLEGRSNLGRPGRHVLTPLKIPGSSAVIVDRGWVPMNMDEPPVAEAAPPRGEVRLTGMLLLPPPRPGFGPDDPPPGRVGRLPRVDLERLAGQVPYPLFPVFLQLEKQKPPASGALPAMAPLSEPDEGPHLSYAIQWFSFAAIASATYLAYLRRYGSRRQLAERALPLL